MKRLATLVMGVVLALTAVRAEAGERLDAIRKKGVLTCGVSADAPGLSRRDARGLYSGFEPDLCRAMAAAIFGDGGKAAFRPIDTVENFLRLPDIDVVLRGLTWTYGREMRPSLRFGPIVLYDGQTFLLRKSLGIGDVAALSGRTICVSSDAEFLPNLRYYFGLHHFVLKVVLTASRSNSETAFFAGHCDAMAADASELAGAVIAKAAHPGDFIILPQEISKEPLAPLLRKGDEEFFDVVRWSIFALIDAEELGIDSNNVMRMRMSDNPDVRAFFATAPAGTGFGRNWSYDIVSSTGNYGAIYQRNLGQDSPAQLPRGLNRLWNSGGVLYAPPLR